MAALALSFVAVVGAFVYHGLLGIALGLVAAKLAASAQDRVVPSLGAYRWRRIAIAAMVIGVGSAVLGLLVAIVSLLFAMAIAFGPGF